MEGKLNKTKTITCMRQKQHYTLKDGTVKTREYNRYYVKNGYRVDTAKWRKTKRTILRKYVLNTNSAIHLLEIEALLKKQRIQTENINTAESIAKPEIEQKSTTLLSSE